jgi:outer membrane protein assembly factor BamB
VYALDAITGNLVWTYQTYCPPADDWDVGAGVTISAPGVNGFADGAAYVENKAGIFYALDLTTGVLYWQNNFGGNGPGQPVVTTDALSTPALSGTTLVFGDINGIYALNAVTGATEWTFAGKQDVNSSPAVVGPVGSQVVAFGTLGDQVDVLSLVTGAELYEYVTGASITSSPADVDGNLLIDSEDGFLYDFAPGGGNGSVPTTTVTSPVSGSTVPNPNGSLKLSGSATAADGVSAVNVEVQENGSSGPWLTQNANGFASGVNFAQATLAHPGADSTSWTLTIPIPNQGGSYQVLAAAVGSNGVADISAFGKGTAAASTDSFSVAASTTAPQLTASSTRVPPGGVVVVSGSKFSSNESVKFTIPKSATATVTLGTATASKTGVLASTSLNIPNTIGFGQNVITAAGTKGKATATLPIYIANNDPQFGYGPLHDGYEANDPVLNKSQATSDTGLLQLSWSLATAGLIDSTPAVVGGTVYVGDESGSLYAVNEVSGDVQWTTAAGSAIESSPAVDSGLVIFGDDGGSLTALSATTGATEWSTALSGAVSSAPVAVDGVVYVGSAGGDLYAINETTGAINWSYQLKGGVVSSPAADVTNGLIIVTDQSGAVTAVTTAGDLAWTFKTSMAIVASPVVSGTSVFAVSTNDKVFSFNENTGAVHWSYTTGGPITAAPGMLGSELIVGSTDGNLYHFNASTGTETGTQAVGAPISGLALATGFIVVTSTNHTMEGLREPTGIRVAWRYDGTDSFASAPVILNGDTYVGDGASQLLAFSALGQPMI